MGFELTLRLVGFLSDRNSCVSRTLRQGGGKLLIRDKIVHFANVLEQ